MHVYFLAKKFAAHCPPFEVSWISGVESKIFDDSGGIFHSSIHEVTVTVPEGAVPKGRQGELKFAATLTAPINFTSSIIPASAIIWLCMDLELIKPIKLCLPHFVCLKTMDQVNNLYFAKMAHPSAPEDSMNIVDGGQFSKEKGFGMIEINHFCYYCIVQNIRAKDIPKNEYRVVTIKNKKPTIDHWKCHVCIIPSLPSCRKVRNAIITSARIFSPLFDT